LGEIDTMNLTSPRRPGRPSAVRIHCRSTTVNGHELTSTDAIESAADAGGPALINLDPGAVIVGTISDN
jgi:hypothetical protein